MLTHAPLGAAPLGASGSFVTNLTATRVVNAATFPGGAIYRFVTVYPVSDISAGGWTNQLGSGSNLFASIDDPTIDDADYIQSPELELNQSNAVIVKLGNMADPNVSQDHTLRYRFDREGELTPMRLIVSLLQGPSTTIASWTHTTVGDPIVQATQALTGPQIDAITDYSDLRLKFEAVGN